MAYYFTCHIKLVDEFAYFRLNFRSKLWVIAWVEQDFVAVIPMTNY